MTRLTLALVAVLAAVTSVRASEPAVPGLPVRAVTLAPPVAVGAAWAPAPAARLRVYILDGVNPVGLAGVGQLAERLRRSGFPRVEVGGWYSAATFEREIRATYAADPTARFAVVGYSFGTYPARSLANRLAQSGVPVAVVAYVGGDYLSDTPATGVPGAGRVVNVTGDGYLLTFNGTEVSGASNVRLAGTWHYALPTHPSTFAALYAALAADGD
jgi:hypothetical protein